ncbi:MAG: hypothetical protein Q8P48_02615, partial [Deltaproteobacteria bacterium]|nr:hypothetical protein [Deltaproteobacteria bacterium]
MTEGYNAERLALFDSLMKKNMGVANGKLWTLEPKEMRFRHGESMAELKIPYHMGGEDEAAVEGAVHSLLLLLTRRFEASIEARGEPVPHLFAGPPLKDKTFRTDIFISDSLEKRLASVILSSASCVDGAILANWL